MYSIIFLEYDPEGMNRTVSHESLRSIIANSEAYDYELVHVKNVKGFVSAVNEGLDRAQGEWLVVVANDVIISDPQWLNKLSVKNVIASWRLTPFFMTGEMRADFACWAIHRDVYKKLGGMNVAFASGYGFDDDDYIQRAKELKILSYDAGITLHHLESLTYNTLFKEEKDAMTERNRTLFEKIWGYKLGL